MTGPAVFDSVSVALTFQSMLPNGGTNIASSVPDHAPPAGGPLSEVLPEPTGMAEES